MPTSPTGRDFIGYGEFPPERLWPNGSRVALSLVINVEDGAERSVARGDSADDLGAHWCQHTADPEQRNLDLESAFEYGARAGIWRVLRILKEHDVRATAFCCAVALEQNPAIADALVRDGHEIADHGYQWDTHTQLSREEELALIRESALSIEETTRTTPTTWYSRDGLNPWTRQTLLDEGFGYDSNSFNDDLPHYGAGEGKLPLVVIPYTGDTNDAGLLRSYPTADAFSKHVNGALDVLLNDTRNGASVLSVGLHPRLIGRPAYAVALDRILTAAQESKVWITTRQEIARAWGAAHPFD